nr:dihydroneopterin aldolase family protein [Candidatus Njordarchaeota archaeon]
MGKERTNDKAKKFFDKSVSDRERATFEGGIALGAIYHQFTGIPISRDPKIIEALEKAIKLTMELQPFKDQIDVKIRKDQIKGSKRDQYDYDVLSGSALEVRVTASYGNAKALVTMKYVPELNYSLMFVEKISEKK